MSEKSVPIRPTFSELIHSIQLAHSELTRQASKAVNICLTVRNWLIGCYIAEYEQNGTDRAEYGQKLIETSMPKVRKMRRMIDSEQVDCLLQVDGGVNRHTTPGLVRAGAEVLVAGNAVFGAAEGVAAAIAGLREAAEVAQESQSR